jgi:hypothetical protein
MSYVVAKEFGFFIDDISLNVCAAKMKHTPSVTTTIITTHKLHTNKMHHITTFYSSTPTYVSAFTRPSSGVKE